MLSLRQPCPPGIATVSFWDTLAGFGDDAEVGMHPTKKGLEDGRTTWLRKSNEEECFHESFDQVDA